jgi:hypothetical protein
MPKSVTVAIGVNATFVTYTTTRASRILVLNAHGMQDAAFVEPVIGGIAPVPHRNYAFTVPWDRALLNPFFRSNETNINRYANTFLPAAHQFTSAAPRMAIYPFFEPITQWTPVFESFILRDTCDIAHFNDLTVGTDFIMFDALLRAPHWSRPGTIAANYDSFLLLTCRSNLARGIGFGGAQPAHPTGLFRSDDAQNPTIGII